jgi:hypothetical protein
VEHESVNAEHGTSRRMQVSLRTTMLIILVLALAIGWWVDRTKLVRRIPGQAQSDMQVKIFSIVNGDVQELTSALQELFPTDTTSSVHIACDSRTKSIMARGTAADLGIVEAILLRLDEQ